MSRPTAQPETCRRDTPDVEAARAGWQRGGAMSRGVAHGEWLTSIVSGIRSGGRIERLTSPAGWLALYQLAT